MGKIPGNTTGLERRMCKHQGENMEYKQIVLAAAFFLSAQSSAFALSGTDRQYSEYCETISSHLHNMSLVEPDKNCSNLKISASNGVHFIGKSILIKDYDRAYSYVVLTNSFLTQAINQKNPACKKRTKLIKIADLVMQISAYVNSK
jgi:hypothetical protein